MTLADLIDAFEYHVYLALPLIERAGALAELQARLTEWQTHTTLELVELLAASELSNFLGVRLADFDHDEDFASTGT